MKRDIMKAVEQGKELMRQRKRMDLTLTELTVLYDRFKELEEASRTSDAALNIIAEAYYAGLAVGSRNA